MKAFMIATGEYERLAALTAPAFEWSTGLPIEVVTTIPDHGLGAENPFAHKLSLPDGEQYIVVDADLVFLRKWAVPAVPLESFGGVKAQLWEAALGEVLKAYGGDSRLFVNTGLFIASKAHREAFAQAKAWMGDGISKLHEESVLNCALQKLGVPMFALPGNVNLQVVTTMYATGIHLCGYRGVEAKVTEATRILRRFAPVELLAKLGLERPEPRAPKKHRRSGTLSPSGRTPAPTPVG